MTSIDIVASEHVSRPSASRCSATRPGAWQLADIDVRRVQRSGGGTPPGNTHHASAADVPTDPALPVGFQDQLFATRARRQATSSSRRPFTWTSETPSVASIDAERRDAPRSPPARAIFRATAADGTTATRTRCRRASRSRAPPRCTPATPSSASPPTPTRATTSSCATRSTRRRTTRIATRRTG